jgi:hypothetical protein
MNMQCLFFLMISLTKERFLHRRYLYRLLQRFSDIFFSLILQCQQVKSLTSMENCGRVGVDSRREDKMEKTTQGAVKSSKR